MTTTPGAPLQITRKRPSRIVDPRSVSPARSVLHESLAFVGKAREHCLGRPSGNVLAPRPLRRVQQLLLRPPFASALLVARPLAGLRRAAHRTDVQHPVPTVELPHVCAGRYVQQSPDHLSGRQWDGRDLRLRPRSPGSSIFEALGDDSRVPMLLVSGIFVLWSNLSSVMATGHLLPADGPAIFLSAVGIVGLGEFIRSGRWRFLVLSAVSCGLAPWAKQTALPILLIPPVFLLLERRVRPFLYYLGTVVVLEGVAAWAAVQVFGANPLFVWLIAIPSSHPWKSVWSTVLDNATRELLRENLPCLTILGWAFATRLFRCSKLDAGSGAIRHSISAVSLVLGRGFSRPCFPSGLLQGRSCSKRTPLYQLLCASGSAPIRLRNDGGVAG